MEEIEFVLWVVGAEVEKVWQPGNLVDDLVNISLIDSSISIELFNQGTLILAHCEGGIGLKTGTQILSKIFVPHPW